MVYSLGQIKGNQMQVIETEKLSEISGGPISQAEWGYLNYALDLGASNAYYQQLYWAYAAS